MFSGSFIAVTDSLTKQRVAVNVAQIRFIRQQGGNTLLDLGGGSFVECAENYKTVIGHLLGADYQYVSADYNL